MDEALGENLDRLLRHLAPDREAAASRYELLRSKLIDFFRWRKWVDSEGLADRVLDRLSQKLAQGTQVVNLEAFALSIARYVDKEESRLQARQRREATSLAVLNSSSPESWSELEVLDRCLEGCLAKLRPSDRTLMLRYYSGEKQARIQNRKELAASLSWSMANLRMHCARLRAKLKGCTLSCAEASKVQDGADGDTR